MPTASLDLLQGTLDLLVLKAVMLGASTRLLIGAVAARYHRPNPEH